MKLLPFFSSLFVTDFVNGTVYKLNEAFSTQEIIASTGASTMSLSLDRPNGKIYFTAKTTK